MQDFSLIMKNEMLSEISRISFTEFLPTVDILKFCFIENGANCRSSE